MNIHNFTNRMLCEYQSIFPNVAKLLDHLLLTNGNGFTFDSKSGMIMDDNGVRIDEHPTMNDKEWDDLIAKCHRKEKEFAERFSSGFPIDLEELAADCALYKRHSVDDSAFSAEAMYKDLCDLRNVYANKHSRTISFVRTYPFSKGYAYIYDLNEKTPKWFVQIALNFCNAWVKFLTEEIDNKNVWIKRSLRTLRKEDKEFAEAMAILAEEIKSDESYDGWLEPDREPESDYADLNWTTKHRDELGKIAKKLETLL